MTGTYQRWGDDRWENGSVDVTWHRLLVGDQTDTSEATQPCSKGWTAYITDSVNEILKQHIFSLFFFSSIRFIVLEGQSLSYTSRRKGRRGGTDLN